MSMDRCSACGRDSAGAPALRSLLPRAVKTAALVGTVLVVLNQGEVLADALWPILAAVNRGDIWAHGVWPASLWWRIPLTFLVPFMVSLHAGYLASRHLSGGGG